MMRIKQHFVVRHTCTGQNLCQKYMRDLIYLNFCRVLTPYFDEPVLFSLEHLEEPNEDGVSILFYLQKIFPGILISSRYLCQRTAWPKKLSCYVKKESKNDCYNCSMRTYLRT